MDVIEMYNLLVLLHVLSAIGSVGPLIVLLVLLNKMKKAEDSFLAGYVQSFQGCIDVVRYAGHAVVITGILLGIFSSWPWTSSWIVFTIIVLVASLMFLAKAFKPTMQTFGTERFDRAYFIAKMQKNTWIYIILLLVILSLMVYKPMLW